MQIVDIRQKSLITAIKTPFDKKGNIDLKTYDALIERQIQFGIDGVVVGGTTGEGHLLANEELLMLIAHTVNKYADKLLVVGSTGDNNTRNAIKKTQFGFASGMHASLQINPYYGKTTAQGIEEHIQSCMHMGPTFIYNVPSRTGQDIQPQTIRNLSKHENFIGLKECTGNQRIALYESEGIACWSGNDNECYEARHFCASHGVISVAANLIPGVIRRLIDQQSESLNQSLKVLFDWLFCEPNPIPLNTALAMLGAIQPVFRLPYVPLDEDKQELGISIMQQLSRQELPGEKLELLNNDLLILA